MTKLICRACGHQSLTSLVDLGLSPLSNAFVPMDRADEGETFYPLHAFVCDACFLVQLGEFETPHSIFAEDYVYFSSFSSSWVEHARQYAEDMTHRFSLGDTAHIAEVASNDGYLLQWFLKAGQKVTGIEPADNCAAASRDLGIHTEQQFFGEATAKQIAADRGHADLIAANNVLAHVPDILDFAAGFREILAPEGVATFEYPHLMNLIRLNQFDTIYHEHFSYLSLRPLTAVMEKVGLRVFDVDELPTHGGSLRMFVCHKDAGHQTSDAVTAMITRENDAGLYDMATYQSFTAQVQGIKDAFLDFLITARRTGKRVAAYGAAAKGTTMLNYCGVGTEYVDYVVDKNPAKQHRYMPGVRIPVRDVEYMIANRPDYVLILPWNLKDEISEQLRAELGQDQKLVVAIPELEIF